MQRDHHKNRNWRHHGKIGEWVRDTIGCSPFSACGGGYGSARVLDKLDYALIASHPKQFIGYSDVTALLAGKPMIKGLPAGHGQNNVYLPLGIHAVMEAQADGSASLKLDAATTQAK